MLTAIKIGATVSALCIIGAVAGCDSTAASGPSVVAPTEADWQSAFASLAPQERDQLRKSAISIDATVPTLDGALYQFGYGPPNGKPIKYDVLDVRSIFAEYNGLFAKEPTQRFRLVKIVSFVGWGSRDEIGTESFTFELDCSFGDISGNIREVSAEAEGPGLSMWHRSGTYADIRNRALALAVLRVLLKLGEPVN